jgi:murein tripeptide amidase MpaA
VLLWSQMHGDESTATSALFDLFEYIRAHRQDAAVRGILSSLTLHVIPMLNPDGAERFQRRNVQSIDINRDALRLQTPEGRMLKTPRPSNRE